MNKTLKRILALSAAFCLTVSALTSCNQAENEGESETQSGTEAEIKDFDYESADLSEYISLPSSAYLNNTVTLGTEYIITDKDVDEQIKKELFSKKEKVTVTDQPIAKGDTAYIYYTGYLDGTAFEGGSNASSEKPHALVIGSGSFIPGFEDGLIGVVPNETSKENPYDLHVTFPEQYSNNPDLAGKAVVFKVWIEYVTQAVKNQPIKYGDSAYIYYTGYLNGTAFEGGSNASSKEPHELAIGSGSFIPGFEDGLIGIVPSETGKENPYELHVTFPEDYGSEELAGKAVIFKVWVEYIVQHTIPELNDDFVKNTLKFDGTVDAYKADLKIKLQESMNAEADKAALNAIISKLMETATISNYPQQSVDYWYGVYIDQFEYYMQYYTMYGMTFKDFDDFVIQYLGLKEGDDWKAVTTEYAKEVVANTLIYYHIAKQENVSVSDAEFDAEVKELVKNYSSEQKKYTEAEIIEQVGEQAIKQSVLFRKLDEFLIKNCTIEFKD